LLQYYVLGIANTFTFIFLVPSNIRRRTTRRPF